MHPFFSHWRRFQAGAFALFSALALAGSAWAQGSLTANPAGAGLWIGDVTLDRVGNLAGPSPTPDATPHPLQFRILLHADRDGRVRLLKEVVIAKRNTPIFDPVLVSDPTRLPTLKLERGSDGAIAGRRISAAGYDFAGSELPLQGGIGQGFRCEGSLVLSNNAPTNPFRHAYHPDHANTGNRSYTIRRILNISFPTPPTNPSGVDTLEAAYAEEVLGLSPLPISVRGTVTLRRVSRVPILNQ